jgi:rhodanese-related sulfurtransferase
MLVKEIEVSELATLFSEKKDFELIDVRTPNEIIAGIIPGTTAAMPLSVLTLRIADIPRDKQVIFYCRSGARSAQACMFLAHQHGFKNVYNLRGGTISWAHNGFPMVSGRDLIP